CAVACTVLDGRPVAVIGTNNDGISARVWDVRSGRRIGELFTGVATDLDGTVRGVACSILDGRPVAIVVAGGGMSFWEVGTGSQIEVPSHAVAMHGPEADAVSTCTDSDGHSVVVVGSRAPGEGSSVLAWDLGHSQQVQQITEPIVGLTGPIRAMACTALDGRLHALTVDPSGGPVRIWEPSPRDQSRSTVSYTTRLTAVACAVLHGRPIAVTGTGTGSVRVWDVATGQPIGEPPSDHSSPPITSVACTVLEGRPVAVALARSGSVRVWDAATGQPIGEFEGGRPFPPVTALACTVLDGRPVAVTHARSGNVRVWDVASRQPIGELEGGHPFPPVTALTCTVLDGRPVAVIATSLRPVRVWDVATGQLVSELATDRFSTVTGVACTVLGGHPLAVTRAGPSWGGDYTRVWDLRTGRQIGVLGTERTDAAPAGVACAVLDGRPIAFTGGRRLEIWDIQTQKPLQRMDMPGHVGHLAVAHDACAVMILGRDIAVFRRHSSQPSMASDQR
ncbi:WD40 repeat domain-containing protein, partial [Streptomyces sp. NPDC058642]|uniref:WD40 repeat domain-containing protein n=1 Tax=Streptomyces sp. NPDC058642 TaxID=3346572 RepID=UPI003661FFF6